MNVNISKYKKALAHIRKALDFMEKALTQAPVKRRIKVKTAVKSKK